jgi:spoIIIJ-associated protein
MINAEEIQKVKAAIEEFLQKMTVTDFNIDATELAQKEPAGAQEGKDAVSVEITLEEPQMLIGQNGQTLFELERIMRMLVNKKLGKFLYISVDINDYKKKKIEYVKTLARRTADEAVVAGQKKVLVPMSSYERRIVHAELSSRQDVTTESQGDGEDRCVVIIPK